MEKPTPKRLTTLQKACRTRCNCRSRRGQAADRTHYRTSNQRRASELRCPSKAADQSKVVCAIAEHLTRLLHGHRFDVMARRRHGCPVAVWIRLDAAHAALCPAAERLGR